MAPAVVLALASACAGEPAPEEERKPLTLIDSSEVVTPGATMFVTVIGGPGAELHASLGDRRLLDGRRLPTAKRGRTWLYRVPPEQPAGSVRLELRAGEQSDSVPIRVVPPSFEDVAAQVGLDHLHDVSSSPPECAESHTGLAVGDYDGDGDPDLYVGHVGKAGRLYRNDRSDGGLPTFTDVTDAVGLDHVDRVASAVFADYDNDGDQDLFVGRRGPNVLLRNDLAETGDPTFSDVTADAGLSTHAQRTMGAAWGDYDGDGDLDLYVVNHVFCFPGREPVRSSDRLYRNDDGRFVDVTYRLELEAPGAPRAAGFSAIWVDYDRDMDQDLVVGNDHIGTDIGRPNVLWRNEGSRAEPQFTEIGRAAGIAIDHVNTMGVAMGDVNRDGWPDLTFTNIGANHLLLSDGDGSFVDVSGEASVGRVRPPWGGLSITWGAHMFDADNDGDLDLYYVGGAIKGEQPMPDAFFRNRGDGTFEDATWSSGLSDPGHGKASVLVDLEGDGLLDIVTARWGQSLRVYHNLAPRAGPRNHWLTVDLRGTECNRDALGAVVELETADGRTQTCFRHPKPSLGGNGELACHFGLGTQTEITRLRIEWPDGTVEEPTPPAPDRRALYVQGGEE